MPEFSTGRASVEDVTLRFSDGERAVPGVFVAEIGGAEETGKLADVARTVTYAEFMRMLADERAGRYLQRQSQSLIDAHLRVAG